MTVNKDNGFLDELFERNLRASLVDDVKVGCNNTITWDPNWPNTSPNIFPNPGITTTTKITFPSEEEEVNIPELYDTDLQTFQYVMPILEDISRVDGVFSVEIRVKTDDVSTWAVIGWGESGDPCILRFEKDEGYVK